MLTVKAGAVCLTIPAGYLMNIFFSSL